VRAERQDACIRFTVLRARGVRSTISRGKIAHATGQKVRSSARSSQLMLTDKRAMAHGLYTLTLTHRDAGREITRTSRITLG
jgi:hypothetical protein